jgi:Holliday junction resolvase
MALSNRQRGDYFERQVVLALRAHGWICQRSAGSLGPADVWAMRNGKTPLFVACKLGGRIDPGERTAILDIADAAGARAVLAMRPRGGRVLLAQIHRGSSRAVPIDTLRVPARPGKQPVEAVP